jgi:hypothetical protein
MTKRSHVMGAMHMVMGIGIFARRNQTREEGELLFAENLFGIFFTLDSDDFQELEEREYPSLFQERENGAIIGGPLSLVNHQYLQNLHFTVPKKMYIEEFEGLKEMSVMTHEGNFDD